MTSQCPLIMTSQGVSSDVHYEITMGNDIDRDIHCDITMSNDVAICVHIMTSQCIMTLL